MTNGREQRLAPSRDPWGGTGRSPASAATEGADARFDKLDSWDDAAILSTLLDGHKRALDAVAPATGDIARAVDMAVATLRRGGRLVYLAAGSPALIALGDALEIPQTYGIARDRIVLVLAGGEAITRELVGGPEDDAGQAVADLDAHAITDLDWVIAVSASGTTPYTVSGLAHARALGAGTVAIAGNRGTALFAHADAAILLETGAEVISGSTRMGAGTAQKAALNMISTLIGVRMGHVHDNLMVNLTADNDKLARRAQSMVARIADVDADRARAALETAQFKVKPAVLIAAGARSLPDANAILERSGGVLRTALTLLEAG